MVHGFATWHFVSRGGIFEPCSLSLWQHGRWSGLVLGALERRAFFYWRHIGHCMFDQCGEPRLGRCDGVGALILRLHEVGPMHDVGAPVA